MLASPPELAAFLGSNKGKILFAHPSYPIPVTGKPASYDWACGGVCAGVGLLLLFKLLLLLLLSDARLLLFQLLLLFLCRHKKPKEKNKDPPFRCFVSSSLRVRAVPPHQILVCGFYQKPPSDSDKQDKYMERRGLFGAAMEQVPNGFNVCSSCLKARCSPWQSYRDAFAQGQPIRFFGLKVGCQRLCCTFEQEFNALPLTHTSFLVVRFYSWALLVCCLSGVSLVRVQFLGKLAVTEEWPAHDVCCCNTQAIIATMALATTTVACANSLLFDSL